MITFTLLLACRNLPSTDSQSPSDSDTGCVSQQYFQDRDGDGYGGSQTTQSCEQLTPAWSLVGGELR